jgi:flagellar motor switch/type III secretory pathway protein FliN
MSSSVLDEEEMAAVRGQMTGAARTRSAAPADAKAVPLIADDRAAERARPIGLQLARRIFQSMQVRLRRWANLSLEARQLEAPIVDADSLRDNLREGWTQVMEVEAPHRGVLLISVGGPLLSVLAMRLLGATGTSATATPAVEGQPVARTTTPATRRLFAPMGERLRAAVCEVLAEEHGYAVRPLNDPERAERGRRELASGDVVAVTVAVGGDAEGWLRLVGRPELLVPPSTPLAAIPAPLEAIRRVLGEVPVDVRVDLGTISLSMSELARLKPGAMLPLEQSPEGLIGVFVGGTLCAMGRPLVSGGSMAVELVDSASRDVNPKESSHG